MGIEPILARSSPQAVLTTLTPRIETVIQYTLLYPHVIHLQNSNDVDAAADVGLY